MIISRRDALMSTLFGAGLVGLRGLATGLPVSLLMSPRRLLADTPAATCTTPQYIILSTSAGGDPINAGAPGTYEDAKIIHSPDITNMGPTPLALGAHSPLAAKPWASLLPAVLNRTAFFHLMTNTPIHPTEPSVLKMMGAAQNNDMLPSLMARELAPCLGTIQAQPISLGATTPAEAITFGGAPQPIIPPTALAATLTTPTGPLANVAGLRSLRDQTMNQLYDLYKNGASPAQQAHIDSMVISQTQLRSIDDNLLTLLSSIKDDGADAQCLAATVLIQLKVTPVISIHIPFGGDNHSDTGLATETAETLAGVQTIANLMAALTSAKRQDDVTFMTLNVFGRTLLVNQPGTPATNGRNHNANHQTSVVIGKAFNPGVYGGVAPVGTDYGATSIGDITAVDTLAAFGQTMLASIGADPTLVSTGGGTAKVIPGALVSG